MRKAELAQTIARDTGLTQKQAQEVVTAFTDQVAQAMAKQQTVSLVGFGTFSVRERSARSGRNPQTGAAITVGASRSVGFKPGKTLKDAIQK
jgi:DNA-binding protein HU-alpha